MGDNRLKEFKTFTFPENYIKSKKDPEAIKDSFFDHLYTALIKDGYSATNRDYFVCLANSARDRLAQNWINTQQEHHRKDAKRVYYLSMEFLIGRTLKNLLINLDMEESFRTAMKGLGFDLEVLAEQEWDAGLGNGGLGRLAACFMDSLSTLDIPAIGYGIRYEYGMFFQHIKDNEQIESPDNWLRYGNPWEVARPERLYPIRFYGEVQQHTNEYGAFVCDWINTENVMAMAYDIPIPGYGNATVNTLRLWSAKSTREFKLEYFNSGNYVKSVQEKSLSENISRVLYPNDNMLIGKELRLKQEYFLVSASLQDIINRYERKHEDFSQFHEKNAIQLNDTHPSLAIPELMRILLDEKRLSWEMAWDITVKTCAYTNHTILPEALESWPLPLFEKLLPRHMQIIYEINLRFLEDIWRHFPGDNDRVRRMSIIEEGEIKKIRMAHLSIVGSHSINGVSALHTEILKHKLFLDFYEMHPQKFNNKTNGITPRRWLKAANPSLSKLITEAIGPKWLINLDELHNLEKYAEDSSFQEKWEKSKKENKSLLINHPHLRSVEHLSSDSLFDIQVKRIHEYKRQMLNVLHVITLYMNIRNRNEDIQPRTVIFGGKAAPGYFTAKQIIKLINCIAGVINSDPKARGLLKVIFVPNYGVSLAERIIPAADLSEQISLAGTEASGTGNMKFSLNGALTIGTMDGANVEIHDAVGSENIFIFGHTKEEVSNLRDSGYNPMQIYRENNILREVLDTISSGFFTMHNPHQFKPLVDSLLFRDEYFLLSDYDSYIRTQKKVENLYRNRKEWNRISILNVANMGAFSSDRTIADYAKEIWNARPLKDY